MKVGRPRDITAIGNITATDRITRDRSTLNPAPYHGRSRHYYRDHFPGNRYYRIDDDRDDGDQRKDKKKKKKDRDGIDKADRRGQGEKHKKDRDDD